ncbi:methyl-accepting chemotaxis protein [bacterium]|nr:MAG: methyl-accepting chemotaxis protein [bacterium]
MLNNMSILNKSIIGFGILFILALTMTVFSITQLNYLLDSSDKVVNDIPIQTALLEIQYATTKGHLYFEEIIAGDKNQSSDKVYELWDEALSYCDIILKGGQKNNRTYTAIRNKKEIEAISNMGMAMEEMISYAKQRQLDSKSGQAGSEAERQFDSAYEKVMSLTEEAKIIASQETKNNYDNLLGMFSMGKLIIGFTGFFLCVIVVGIGYFISTTIVTPIKAAAKLIDKDGINTVFKMNRHDEVGRLTRSMNNFLSSFRDVLIDVVDASRAVATSSKEISASTETMATNAREQSLHTNGITSAVEEMSKTVYEISHNASSAKEMALHAQSSATQGAQVIDETAEGISKMVGMIKQSTDVVNSLSDSSGKIGKILNIIEDITKQINLIALNASIEATKAGERGKGFAVVADEIKKLAERTTHSTAEINEMIVKIQTNVSEAVNLMARTREKADSAITLSHDAKSSLKEISEVFQEVTQMVAQIAVSSHQQSITSDQIADNIKIINQSTQQVAAGIQEIAKSADYFKTLTDSMQKRVNVFKVDERL